MLTIWTIVLTIVIAWQLAQVALKSSRFLKNNHCSHLFEWQTRYMIAPLDHGFTASAQL